MKLNWKKEVLILSVILAAVPMMYFCEGRRMQEEIAGKILRFHVIANSDSRQDQELKLKVRDAVGLYMKEEMKTVNNLGEAEQKAQDHLDEIEKIAQEVIKQEGKSYSVSALIGPVDFPVKTYGEYSFPAGTYEALEIVIGEGRGRNWWCVMYPNMCFQGSMYEVVDDEAQESLREVLTQEEYDSVIESGNYRVQFKYLPFLNQYL